VGEGGEEKNLRTLVPGQEELEALQCMEEKVPPSKKKEKNQPCIQVLCKTDSCTAHMQAGRHLEHSPHTL
jgi:hypothetical protein